MNYDVNIFEKNQTNVSNFAQRYLIKSPKKRVQLEWYTVENAGYLCDRNIKKKKKGKIYPNIIPNRCSYVCGSCDIMRCDDVQLI